LVIVSVEWYAKPEEPIAQLRVTVPVFGIERVPLNLMLLPRLHVVVFVDKVKVGVGTGVDVGSGVAVGTGVGVGVDIAVGVEVGVGEEVDVVV
jgi:hypothetical protein